MSDFVKLMKNKFKPRNYRTRPPKKLGYLPVQTIMEGTSIETPSVPSAPDMSFAYPRNEEHRLIAQMCQQMSDTLNSSGEPGSGSPQLNGHSGTGTPMSPSEIIATLQLEKKQDVDEVIRELEEEHKTLEAEYIRLKGMRTPGRSSSNNSLPRNLESATDAEMMAEAKSLKQHKGRLEARMQILEDHNRQLEAQLQRLRQLLEQPPSERAGVSINVPQSPQSNPSTSPARTRKDINDNDASLTNGCPDASATVTN